MAPSAHPTLYFYPMTIEICDYQESWPTEFSQIQAALAAALGELALRIDHIGSTSVPGLGAKDVIDVQVAVAALADELRERLLAAGFRQSRPDATDHVPRGEDEDPALWRKFLFKEPAGTRRSNIHIRILGYPNQRYPLLFRDYLRSHPNSASTIELIKRQLARYHADDIEAYYDIKDPVYDLIWEAAKEWAEATGWTP